MTRSILFYPNEYWGLLEIIPTPHTDLAVVNFMLEYGDLFLVKTTVLARNNQDFIANRMGVFSMMVIVKIMGDLQ